MAKNKSIKRAKHLYGLLNCITNCYQPVTMETRILLFYSIDFAFHFNFAFVSLVISIDIDCTQSKKLFSKRKKKSGSYSSEPKREKKQFVNIFGEKDCSEKCHHQKLAKALLALNNWNTKSENTKQCNQMPWVLFGFTGIL